MKSYKKDFRKEKLIPAHKSATQKRQELRSKQSGENSIDAIKDIQGEEIPPWKQQNMPSALAGFVLKI